MPKILVVDDESLIREWLVMCLQAAGLDQEKIHQACNGEEALAMIRDCSYDLIFTDITMPKLDGIQLIRAIRELDARVTLIILTCHDDFSFARSAVKYNVYEYLLKNELTQKDVIDLVKRILQSSLEQADVRKSRNEFLRGLLHQGGTSSLSVTRKELLEALLLHHVELDTEPYFVMAFNDRSCSADELDWSMNQQLGHVITFYSGIHVTLLIAVLSCEPAQYDTVMAYVGHLVSQCSADAAHTGRSLVYHDPALLPDALNEAVLSWELQFFGRPDLTPLQAASDHISASHRLKSSKQMIHDKKSEILLQYPINGTGLSEKLTLDLCSQFVTEQLWDSSLLKRTVIDIMEGIDNRPDNTGAVHIRDYISSVMSASSLETVLACISRFFSALPETDHLTDYIKDTKEYIAMHYNQPLTLAGMAERVHLSEEYFSRLFKKEVGKTFTEYMMEIRMVRAKKLLQSSPFHVNEIGEMVGIQNPSYFSSQFKRYYGISPRAIREEIKNDLPSDNGCIV